MVRERLWAESAGGGSGAERLSPPPPPSKKKKPPRIPPSPDPPSAAMRVKLKNVFIVYFVVSLVGLLCALLQLGEWGGGGG